MLSAGFEDQEKVIIVPANEVGEGHCLPDLTTVRPLEEIMVVEEFHEKAQSPVKEQEKVPDWLVLHIREILGEVFSHM